MEVTSVNKPTGKLWRALLTAVVLGVIAYGIRIITGSPIVDPLLVAIILGIITRAIMRENRNIKQNLKFIPSIFIPAGIVFYAANNLNFAVLMEVENNILALLIVIMIVYFAVILLLGKLIGQRKQITYLTATGSAICGASAIAVVSPAVEAEPEDVSISLLSVALTGFIGFSMIIPFVSALLNLECETYCIMTGSVLQFTGLVKASNVLVPHLKNDMPVSEMQSLALSLKAVRYLGLIVAIPLFASLVRKKLYFPWFLWAFLAAGAAGTYLYITEKTFYVSTLIPLIKPVHVVSWSIAMAAIGLNADIKELLSHNGTRAILMTMGGFLSAVLTFLAGFYILTNG